MNDMKRWRRANLAAIRTAVTYGQTMGRMCAKNGLSIRETLTLVPDTARRTPYWRAFIRTLFGTYWRTNKPGLDRSVIHRQAAFLSTRAAWRGEA